MATELLALCSTPFRDSMTGFDALVVPEVKAITARFSSAGKVSKKWSCSFSRQRPSSNRLVKEMPYSPPEATRGSFGMSAS